MPPRKRRTLPRRQKSRRIDVSRGEFNRVVDIVNRRKVILENYATKLAALERELDIQFKRIAQLQQELDGMKKSLAKG